MANKLVDLIIRAKDGASDTLRRIGGALGGLRAQAGNAAEGAQNIGDAMFGAIMKANLLGFALSKVGEAAAIMGQKFEEAKQVEIGDVSAASTFMALTGKSFQESTKFVGDFSKEISQIAGALPGATKDYNAVANSIMDNLIPTFKDANGVLDQGAFQQNLVGITKKMTLLGVASGTHSQAVGMFTARLLDGNIASARQLLFADNNPAFMNLLETETKKRGKKIEDWKKLSSKERLEIAQAVSGSFVSKEVIDAASNTVEGILAGIESSIFDPKSGVFGLLRDLSDNPGNQTVMSSIAGAIKGIQEFFQSVGNLLTSLGVPSIDPMMAVYNGINKFTEFINQAAAIIGNMAGIAANQGGILEGLEAINKKYLNLDFLLPKFQRLFKDVAAFLQPIFDKYLSINNIQAIISGTANGLSGIIDGIGNTLPSALTSLAAFLQPIFDKYINFDNIQSLITVAANGLSGIINSVTARIPSFISGIVGFLAPFVEKYLNPTFLLAQTQKLFDSIGGVINSFFASTASLSGNLVGENGAQIAGAFAYFGHQIGYFAYGLIGKLGQFVINLPWGDILITIGNVTIAGIASLAAGLAGLFLGAWDSYKQNVIPVGMGLLSSMWENFVLVVKGLGISFMEVMQPASDSFFNWLGTEINDLWESLTGAISNAIKGLKQQALSLISSPIESASNAWNGATNFVNGAVSDPLGAVGNAASGVGNAVNNFFNPPAYNGHIPTASGGFLGALATESRNMPSGASPVIANSSEWILTPDQLQRIMFSSANVGAASQAPASINVGDIHIHGIPNPAAIADAVIAEIEARLSNYQQSVLA